MTTIALNDGTGLRAGATLATGLDPVHQVRNLQNPPGQSENPDPAACWDTLGGTSEICSRRDEELLRARVIAQEADQLRLTVSRFHSLMQQVRTSPDLRVDMDNPDIPSCWQVKNCKRTQCSCYGKPPLRCWQVAGTHCEGTIQGTFARKVARCEECEVYKQSTPTTLAAVSETFHNMMHTIRCEHDALEVARAVAEQSVRIKGEFLANMSHEVRTPLNGVLGMAEVVLSMDLPLDVKEYVGVIRSSGYTLLTLLDEILDFSKLEVDRLEIEQADFDLVEAVEPVAAVLGVRAREKGLAFAWRIHPDVPRRIRGDAVRLKQVLTNLVGNAIKFTERGEVAVDVERMGDDADCPVLRILVADTGVGIPPDRLPRVFDPFTQADASPTRRHGGAGLGLALAKRLVETMGGAIGVETTEGKGSSFWFTLPLVLAGEPLNQQSRPPR